MQFVQVLEFRTSEFAKVQALDNEWRQATEGKRTLRRSIVCRDRSDEHRYLVFAFFDSPDSAKVNSELRETTEFAEGVSAIVDAPISFRDLDVIEDRS